MRIMYNTFADDALYSDIRRLYSGGIIRELSRRKTRLSENKKYVIPLEFSLFSTIKSLRSLDLEASEWRFHLLAIKERLYFRRTRVLLAVKSAVLPFACNLLITYLLLNMAVYFVSDIHGE